jgi:hypothetical protein
VLAFPENDPTDPTTNITGAFTIGGLNNFPQGRTSNEFQWLDTATWVHGKHTVKFGVNIARQRLFNLAAFDSKGTYGFNNFADFLNNQAATLALALNTASFDARQVQQSYFVQDDLKVTRNAVERQFEVMQPVGVGFIRKDRGAVVVLESVGDRLAVVLEIEHEAIPFLGMRTIEPRQRLHRLNARERLVHIHGVQERLVVAGLELFGADQEAIRIFLKRFGNVAVWEPVQ